MIPDLHSGFDAHERVEFFADRKAGVMGIIAIHSTHRGPAMGGCRVGAYAAAAAALTDALRLSQGMSYKNALADLPAGGGKAVLYRMPDDARREAAFEAFGLAVESLGGRYVTAEDVGTSVADMEAVARRSTHVAGLPRAPGLAGGDPSPWTALGVFEAIKVAAGRPLSGARVAVQGVGSVGFRLCVLLREAGAQLVVADAVEDRAQAVRLALGAETLPADRIHAAPADVFSPNALGAGLNADTIAELQAPVVCGGANNQLATAEDGMRLLERGVVYAPDYLVNAGGIINVVGEHLGRDPAWVEARVKAIAPRLERLLAEARVEGVPPSRVADRLARARIGRSPVLTAA